MSSDSIARMKPIVHASLCAFVAAIALLVFVRMNLAASLIANFKMSSCWNEVGSWLDSSLWRFVRKAMLFVASSAKHPSATTQAGIALCCLLRLFCKPNEIGE